MRHVNVLYMPLENEYGTIFGSCRISFPLTEFRKIKKMITKIVPSNLNLCRDENGRFRYEKDLPEDWGKDCDLWSQERSIIATSAEEAIRMYVGDSTEDIEDEEYLEDEDYENQDFDLEEDSVSVITESVPATITILDVLKSFWIGREIVLYLIKRKNSKIFKEEDYKKFYSDKEYVQLSWDIRQRTGRKHEDFKHYVNIIDYSVEATKSVVVIDVTAPNDYEESFLIHTKEGSFDLWES